MRTLEHLLELRLRIYRRAVSARFGDAPLVLPIPWQPRPGNAPLPRLTRYPALFQRYLRQEHRILQLLEARRRILHRLSNKISEERKELRDAPVQLQLRKRMLKALSAGPFVDEMLAQMTEELLEDMLKKDRINTVPIAAVAHKLLEYLERNNVDVIELRSRFSDMRQMERDHLPWRYEHTVVHDLSPSPPESWCSSSSSLSRSASPVAETCPTSASEDLIPVPQTASPPAPQIASTPAPQEATETVPQTEATPLSPRARLRLVLRNIPERTREGT
jgi:hypothetical protein